MRRTVYLVLLVFCVALGIRLAFVAPMPMDNYRSAFSSDNTLDSKAYVDIAKSLREHGVYGYGGRPSAYRPPAYPWLLAGSFWAFGENYRVVRFVQALLGAATCVSLFGIGLVLFNRWVGLLAGLALAVYPFAIYFSGSIMTEGLFHFLATTALLLALCSLQRDAGGWVIVAAGVMSGLATLCRPTFVPFLAFAVAAGVGARVWSRIALLKPLLVVGLLGFAIVSPWIVRNSMVFGRPVFITTYTGLNLYEGLPGKDQVTQHADFGYNYHTIEDPSLAVLPKPEVEMEREQRAYWRRFVLEHPVEFAREKLEDVAQFWFDFNLAGNLGRRAGLVRLAPFLAYAIVLAGGVGATILLWTRGQRFPVLFVWTVILLTMGLTIIIFAGKRYRIPTVDTYLILLTAWLVWDRLARIIPALRA